MLLKRQQVYAQRQRLSAVMPEADDAVMMTVRAWHDLDTCRPVTTGYVGAIPWDVIGEWAREHGLDRASTELLRDVIRQLDGERAHKEQVKRNLERATGGKDR